MQDNRVWMEGQRRSFRDVLHGAVVQGFNIMQSASMANSTASQNQVVKVSPDFFRKRMDICKFSIIGWVILAKGGEPWNLSKLKEKRSSVWSLKSSWRLISLGRGYYHVLLSSAEERDRVWFRGSINLHPGVLRLQRWSFGFDQLKEKSTHAQVWVRLYHLLWCLWDPSILADIARQIGSPLKFDKATVEGDFGHLTRVLIDVDLAKPIKQLVPLECEGAVFDIKVVLEGVTSFCKACSTIGYTSSEWRALQRKDDVRGTQGKKAAAADVTPRTNNEVEAEPNNEITSEGKGADEDVTPPVDTEEVSETVPKTAPTVVAPSTNGMVQAPASIMTTLFAPAVALKAEVGCQLSAGKKSVSRVETLAECVRYR